MGTHPIFESDFDCLTEKMIGAKANVLPLFIRGTVVKGFGRGSKELGCPTANFSEEVVAQVPEQAPYGIYYGFAQVDDGRIYKMVASIGKNPFYGNDKRSFETHIIHQFDSDFYGSNLGVAVIGYLRDEKNYDSIEALKADIAKDIQNATKKCEEGEFNELFESDFFRSPTNNNA